MHRRQPHTASGITPGVTHVQGHQQKARAFLPRTPKYTIIHPQRSMNRLLKEKDDSHCLCVCNVLWQACSNACEMIYSPLLFLAQSSAFVHVEGTLFWGVDASCFGEDGDPRWPRTVDGCFWEQNMRFNLNQQTLGSHRGWSDLKQALCTRVCVRVWGGCSYTVKIVKAKMTLFSALIYGPHILNI